MATKYFTPRNFSAPFILKYSFYSPSKSNQAKNAAHIDYIGTRPGVEHGDMKLDEMEDEVLDPDSAAGHVKYADERPGSHGLFDDSGDKPDLSIVQEELKNHDGVVWRMILSLKEEDAKQIGYTDRSKWEDMLRATVPDAAKQMGIRESNLRWAAAFHNEPGHPHVHLVFWEKNPERTRGMISIGEGEDLRRIFTNEIYKEDKARLYQEKTINRDLMRDLAKGDVQTFTSILREIKAKQADVELELQSYGENRSGIAPKLYSEDQKGIAKQLHELAETMPKKGRIAFQYMPDEVKQKALSIADSMLKQISFRETLEKYYKSVEEITGIYNRQPEAIQQAKNHAYKELQKRIANIALRGASEVNRSSSIQIQTSESTQRQIRELILKAKTDPAISQEALTRIQRNLARTLVVLGHTKEESLVILEQWNQRSHLQLKEQDLEKVLDKAIKFQKDQKEWGRDIVVSKKHWKELFEKIGTSQSPPWLWQKQPNPAMSLARSFWKETFKVIEQEQMKSQAQADLQRRQTEAQQKKVDKKREQESWQQER